MARMCARVATHMASRARLGSSCEGPPHLKDGRPHHATNSCTPCHVCGHVQGVLVSSERNAASYSKDSILSRAERRSEEYLVNTLSSALSLSLLFFTISNKSERCRLFTSASSFISSTVVNQAASLNASSASIRACNSSLALSISVAKSFLCAWGTC